MLDAMQEQLIVELYKAEKSSENNCIGCLGEKLVVQIGGKEFLSTVNTVEIAKWESFFASEYLILGGSYPNRVVSLSSQGRDKAKEILG